MLDTLEETERMKLREASAQLLARGSILRSRPATVEIYEWCLRNREVLGEWADLIGLKIDFLEVDRTILATPLDDELMLRLSTEETLILLALWHDYDVELRERGEMEAVLSIEDFTARLMDKFPNMKRPGARALRSVLTRFKRYNLVEVEGGADFVDGFIRISPVIRYVLPFASLEEWMQRRDGYMNSTENDEGSES